MNKKQFYTSVRNVRGAIRRKRPEKPRTNSWFLIHDDAPAHRSVLAKDFLAKNNVTTLECPSVSPDLTAADFYLFPQLKSALKEWRFCYDITDIIKNTIEQLQRISQNGFQEVSKTFTVPGRIL
jgi:hypothetical protein